MMRCDNGMITAFYSPKDLKCISLGEQEHIKREVSKYYNVCKEILSEQKNPLFIEAHNVLMRIRRMANRKDWPMYYITSSDISFARSNSAELFLNKKFNASHCCKTVVDLYDRFIARGKRLNRAQYNKLRQALLECSVYAYKVRDALRKIKLWYSRRGRLLKDRERKYDVKTSIYTKNRRNSVMTRCGRLIPGTRCMPYPIVISRPKKYPLNLNPDEYCVDEILKLSGRLKKGKSYRLPPIILSPIETGDARNLEEMYELYRKISKSEALNLKKAIQSVLNEYKRAIGFPDLYKYMRYGLNPRDFINIQKYKEDYDILINNADKIGLTNKEVAKLQILKNIYSGRNFAQNRRNLFSLLSLKSVLERALDKLSRYIDGDKNACFSIYDKKMVEKAIKGFKKTLDKVRGFLSLIKNRIGIGDYIFLTKLLSNWSLKKAIEKGDFVKARQIVETIRILSPGDQKVTIMSINRPSSKSSKEVKVIDKSEKRIVIKPVRTTSPPKSGDKAHTKNDKVSMQPIGVKSPVVSTQASNSGNHTSSLNLSKYAPYIAAGGIALLLLMNRD